jgi:hypothetical protein
VSQEATERRLKTAHLCAPLRHPTGDERRPTLTRENVKGIVESTWFEFCPPPRLQVNRGTCRFGRYKNPRRPHPPPRASRVSHHPPQVSGLTHRRPLDQSTPAARVHFWPLVSAAAMGSHDGVVSGCNAYETSERSLPPSRLLFSFSSHLAASLSLAGSFVFSSTSTPALLCVDTLHFSLVLHPFYFAVAPALSFPFLSFPSRWVENAPPRITIEQ